MLKKMMYLSVILTVFTSIYLFFNSRLAIICERYDNKINYYKQSIDAILEGGIVKLENIQLVDWQKNRYGIHEKFNDETTIVLRISERNCTECNVKSINRIEYLCKEKRIPLLILVFDAKSPEIVRKKYGKKCYLVQGNIRSILGDENNIYPTLFILNRDNYGFGFIEAYRNSTSIISNYLDSYRAKILESANL